MREIHDTDEAQSFKDRVDTIWRTRKKPVNDPLDTSGSDPFPNGGLEPLLPNQGFGVNESNTDTILACVDCETYYEDNSEWEYCPQCATELTTMEKA